MMKVEEATRAGGEMVKIMFCFVRGMQSRRGGEEGRAKQTSGGHGDGRTESDLLPLTHQGVTGLRPGGSQLTVSEGC